MSAVVETHPPSPSASKDILARERDYYDQFYSGFGREFLARPAIRSLRAHMLERLRRLTGVGPSSRLLSLGCGIGDAEILLAPHVAEVVGLDLSAIAIEEARRAAAEAGVKNLRFLQGSPDSLPFPPGSFDLVFALAVLHHLPPETLSSFSRQVFALLSPRGKFYSLDPNRRRLAGWLGQLFVPHLMKRFQSPDERELDPAETADLFRGAGFHCQYGFYDFLSSPLAALLPGWRAGYRLARRLDDLLIHVPLLRQLGNTFEILAVKSA